MRKIILASLCYLIGGPILSAQNLVVNPGFEEFGKLTHKFSSFPKDFNIPGWDSPTTGTPDYFNIRAINDVGVPENFAGKSKPHGGVAYVGIFTAGRQRSAFQSGYREYIRGRLLEPMVKDSIYEIGFYYRLSSNSGLTSNRIGLLVVDSLQFQHSDGPIQIKPTLDVDRPGMQAGPWEYAHMSYRAKGGERFVIIGNFFTNQQTDVIPIPGRENISSMVSGSAFYYLDDVEVIAPKELVTDESHQPNDSVKVPSFILRHLRFAFDEHKIDPTSFAELDSLAALLLKKTWKLRIAGYTDEKGSEDYNQKLSAERAKAVKQYLMQKGLAEDRLFIYGFGETVPVSSSSSAAENRRVEFTILR